MENEIATMLQNIINERGVPKNIKNSIEESMNILNSQSSLEEKIAYILSVLDEAINDPNLSGFARTNIWNIVSNLEEMKNRNKE